MGFEELLDPLQIVLRLVKGSLRFAQMFLECRPLFPEKDAQRQGIVLQRFGRNGHGMRRVLRCVL